MTYISLPVERLLDWYRQHERPLPWRDEPTPYRVWISETMLQQRGSRRREDISPGLCRNCRIFPPSLPYRTTA